MNNRLRNIVFTAMNPGGFNAIAPLIQQMAQEKSCTILLLCAQHAVDMAKKFHVPCIDATRHTKKTVKEFFEESPVDLLIAGTSTGMSVEKYCIEEAQLRNIPSIAVVDFWSNYAMRFSTPETRDLAYLPNMVCAIDDSMKNGMMKEGISESSIMVTGNPFFDTFKKEITQVPDCILFISQPFSEIYKEVDPYLTAPVFDEVAIFSDVVTVLVSLDVQLPVYIAFHPRSTERQKFDTSIRDASLDIRILDGSTESMLHRSAVVVGMNSVMLFQAALSGIPTVSYQPGITAAQDTLESNRLGISRAAYQLQDLEKRLRECMDKGAEVGAAYRAARKKYVEHDATKRVMSLIYSFLSL